MSLVAWIALTDCLAGHRLHFVTEIYLIIAHREINANILISLTYKFV